MEHEEYASYDAVGLAELVRDGAVGPADLEAAARSRIAEVDDRINAVVVELAPSVASADGARGPFGGVPFLLEELLTSLAAGGVAPSAGSAASVTTVTSRTVGHATLLRLPRIAPAAVAVARAVAVLGSQATVAVSTPYSLCIPGVTKPRLAGFMMSTMRASARIAAMPQCALVSGASSGGAMVSMTR